MKQFVKPIPANINSANSGSPLSDVVKSVEALVEIRSNVPSEASDVGAATAAQLTQIEGKIAQLETIIDTINNNQ